MFAGIALAVLFLSSPASARADVVHDWNVIMLTTLAGQSPFQTARYAAITQLAVFEAVNAIAREYAPYLVKMNTPDGASADAAAVAAAYAVLIHYFPSKAPALDAARATSLSAIPDGDAENNGIAVGKAAAEAIIEARKGDGSGSLLTLYDPPAPAPGQWQPTPSCGVGMRGTNFHWRGVTPFGLTSGDQFRLGPPPSLSTGAYAKAYGEVQSVGLNTALRPQDREEVARFYAAFSPVSVANTAARQASVAQATSLSYNARALALLNMAVSDAAVAAFDTKYHYNFWRPETAIRAGADDGNDKTLPDGGFAPLIGAPCFPAYPSAHGTLSAAAREVLERLFGRGGHDVTFTSAAFPDITLHYTTFKAIIADISDARVFGGIHFRFDQDSGEHQGREVGAYIVKHHLRAVHPQ